MTGMYGIGGSIEIDESFQGYIHSVLALFGLGLVGSSYSIIYRNGG